VVGALNQHATAQRWSSLVIEDAECCVETYGERLHRAVDGIRERYGYAALGIALADARQSKR
jgi:hypothetical protein